MNAAVSEKAINKLKNSLPGKLSALIFLCAGWALLVFSVPVRDNIKNSAVYCLTALIPSLFPFMALTSFAVNSGAEEALGGCLGLPTRLLFRLPSVCAVPILMSFLGGYPAGAKGASLLLEQGKIDREQAERMMLFCVNPGTAFVVTFLGGVLGSFRTGWLLFFAVTCGGLLLGILSGLGRPLPFKGTEKSALPAGGALIRSVNDASRSVVVMCACILLFSGLNAILHSAGIFQALCGLLSAPGIFTPMESASLLSFLLEVTGGVGAAAQLRVGPDFYAFGLAFGGLCVHLQVFSFFQSFPGPKWKFFLFRFLHGLLAAGFFRLFESLLPGGAAETSASAAVTAVSPLSGTLAGGLSLLLMCAAFLLIAAKKDGETEENIVNRRKK